MTLICEYRFIYRKIMMISEMRNRKWAIIVHLHVTTTSKSAPQHLLQLNKLRGVSLLGILQECGELGRMMPWGH
jgi:hypothetical protein